MLINNSKLKYKKIYSTNKNFKKLNILSIYNNFTFFKILNVIKTKGKKNFNDIFFNNIQYFKKYSIANLNVLNIKFILKYNNLNNYFYKKFYKDFFIFKKELDKKYVNQILYTYKTKKIIDITNILFYKKNVFNFFYLNFYIFKLIIDNINMKLIKILLNINMLNCFIMLSYNQKLFYKLFERINSKFMIYQIKNYYYLLCFLFILLFKKFGCKLLIINTLNYLISIGLYTIFNNLNYYKNKIHINQKINTSYLIKKNNSKTIKFLNYYKNKIQIFMLYKKKNIFIDISKNNGLFFLYSSNSSKFDNVINFYKKLQQCSLENLMIDLLYKFKPIYMLDSIVKGKQSYKVPYLIKKRNSQFKLIIKWWSYLIINKFNNNFYISDSFQVEFIDLIYLRSKLYLILYSLNKCVINNKAFKHYRWW